MSKLICIDLFCGLFGWGVAFAQEGYTVIGFDLEDMCAKFGIHRPEGCGLALQDVLTLHGSQFKNATCIVASPPCQAYSYRAMPWKRAKALPLPPNELFDACFRIQREACEAAKRYIPLIVENVRGAQPWVGRAKWHYRSYYLWGDVPALMPVPPDSDGIKIGGGPSLDGHFSWDLPQRAIRKKYGRERASAMIAKIPFPLAQHIAATFKRSPITPGSTIQPGEKWDW